MTAPSTSLFRSAGEVYDPSVIVTQWIAPVHLMTSVESMVMMVRSGYAPLKIEIASLP